MLKRTLISIAFLSLVLFITLNINALSLNAAPSQITLCFNGDPKTSIGVSWQTAVDVDEGLVQLALFGSVSEGEFVPERTIDAETATVKIGSETFNTHKVVVGDLSPNTKYAYRVGNEGFGFSPVHSFTTAPPEGETFSFLFITDTQGYRQLDYDITYKTITAALANNPAIRFIVHAGDLTDNGINAEQWRMFYSAKQLPDLPIIHSIGNHDMYNGGIAYYDAYYNSKSPAALNENAAPSDTVYAVDYGDMRIAVMNTEADDLNGQGLWLEKAIKENRKHWNLAVMHRGIYPSTARSDDVEAAWKPLFNALEFDLVLQGHDHVYMRTFPIYADYIAKKGCIYLIGNAAGPKRYTGNKRWWQQLLIQPEKPSYCIVTVSPDSITVQALNEDGSKIDEFVIDKVKNGEIVY